MLENMLSKGFFGISFNCRNVWSNSRPFLFLQSVLLMNHTNKQDNCMSDTGRTNCAWKYEV